jgi:large subunit ribosomal protein L6
MSRVGKYPVEIPAGVQAVVASGRLTVTGKLGEMSLALSDRIEGIVEANQIVVKPRGNAAPARMMWGTTRALVANMVRGVSTGYAKSLEITGTGFRAAVNGGDLVLNLGYAHDVVYPIPEGIKITCERPTLVKIEGVDKRLVGQVASEIRAWRPPEPYKGKGIKYQGEQIRRKEGKKK